MRSRRCHGDCVHRGEILLVGRMECSAPGVHKRPIFYFYVPFPVVPPGSRRVGVNNDFEKGVPSFFLDKFLTNVDII